MPPTENGHKLTISLSYPFFKRLKHLARMLNSPMSRLILDATIEKIETSEKHFLEHAEKTAYDARTRGIGRSPLGPLPAKKPGNQDGEITSSELTFETATPQQVVVSVDDPSTIALYEEHAQKILEVLSDTTEKRVRINEAIAAIRDAALIVEPTEEEIRRRLQMLVVKKLKEQPKKQEPPKPPVPDLADVISPELNPYPFKSPHTGKTVSMKRG